MFKGEGKKHLESNWTNLLSITWKVDQSDFLLLDELIRNSMICRIGATGDIRGVSLPQASN